jgi:hypothetical protein
MFCPECGQVTGTGPLDTRFTTEAARRGVIHTLLAAWRARLPRTAHPPASIHTRR